jgi:hypothetical protein
MPISKMHKHSILKAHVLKKFGWTSKTIIPEWVTYLDSDNEIVENILYDEVFTNGNFNLEIWINNYIVITPSHTSTVQYFNGQIHSLQDFLKVMELLKIPVPNDIKDYVQVETKNWSRDLSGRLVSGS